MNEWRKSSRCEANNCVEVNLAERVGVRDSVDPGPRLEFGAEQWRAFIADVRRKAP